MGAAIFLFIRNNDGSITLIADMIVQKPVVIQPQSATAIVENETGYIRGMIGGRGITGSLLFNRANNPRQTGSSIKPLSVYSEFFCHSLVCPLLTFH